MANFLSPKATMESEYLVFADMLVTNGHSRPYLCRKQNYR